MGHALRLAIAILLAATALNARAQTIWSGTTNVADAFVTTGPANNLGGNNYGGAGAMAISGPDALRGSTFNGLFDSVLRFDLAEARALFDAAYGVGLWSVQSVTLRLSTTTPNNPIFNDNSSGQFGVTWMENDGWTEGSGSPMSPGGTGVTYNTLPGFLGANDQSVGIFSFDAGTGGADGTLLTYTLTPGSGFLGDLAGGSLASFYLSAETDGISYLFNSRSFGTASRRPLLTITAVPEPSTLLLAGLPILGFAASRRRRRE